MHNNKDLSKIDDSVTSWLQKNIQEINKIYNEKEKLLEKLSKMKEEASVSDSWYDTFMYRIQHNTNEQNIKYIYNVYLKGCSLSTEQLNIKEYK